MFSRIRFTLLESSHHVPKPFFKEKLELFSIKSVINDFLRRRGFGPFAIPDSLNKATSRRVSHRIVPSRERQTLCRQARSWPLQVFLAGFE